MAKPLHGDWYDTPLYYDIIYDADTKSEARFLEGAFDRHASAAGTGRRLLEPACGSGRLVVEMARRGWQVSGFDGSPRCLDFTRRRLAKAGLNARLWRDWMQQFTVPGRGRFELVHCLINTFRYLLSAAQAESFLRRVSGCLVPGGIFVLGLHLTDYGRTRCEHERWVGSRRGVTVVCNTRTWPPDRRRRIERLRTRLAITHDGESLRQETNWEYRTYDAAQLKRLLAAAVPELEIVGCYDFHCDLNDGPRELSGDFSDVVIVMEKRRPSRGRRVR